MRADSEQEKMNSVAKTDSFENDQGEKCGELNGKVLLNLGQI